MNTLTLHLTELTSARKHFILLCEQLDVSQRDQTGVCGVWTPKDVIAHLIGWDTALLEFITDADSFTPPHDVDQFNRKSVSQRKRQSWAEVMRESDDIYLQLIQCVEQTTPDFQYHGRVESWLTGRTKDYLHHGDQLAAWKNDQIH